MFFFQKKQYIYFFFIGFQQNQIDVPITAILHVFLCRLRDLPPHVHPSGILLNIVTGNVSMYN